MLLPCPLTRYFDQASVDPSVIVPAAVVWRDWTEVSARGGLFWIGACAGCGGSGTEVRAVGWTAGGSPVGPHAAPRTMRTEARSADRIFRTRAAGKPARKSPRPGRGLRVRGAPWPQGYSARVAAVRARSGASRPMAMNGAQKWGWGCVARR